mgnify:CR=1 FL=1
MKERIKDIISYSDMIGSLVKKDLRGKYKGSVLGFLWTFINPLCQIIVYTIVFSVIVRSNLDKFYVYMIVGMIPWLFFDMSLRQGSGCVRYQGDMIKKIYFPREVLPVSFVIVFAVLFISGIGVRIEALLYLPLIMAIEYLLSLGFALIVSAGTVFFKDLEHITTVVLMAWIYGTPIMYSLEMIPANIKWLFKVNPMTAVIESYHRILYWKELPLGKDILYSAVFAIVMVIIGELVFAKLDDNFAEEL